jgi:hypothetical protein
VVVICFPAPMEWSFSTSRRFSVYVYACVVQVVPTTKKRTHSMRAKKKMQADEEKIRRSSRTLDPRKQSSPTCTGNYHLLILLIVGLNFFIQAEKISCEDDEKSGKGIVRCRSMARRAERYYYTFTSLYIRPNSSRPSY